MVHLGVVVALVSYLAIAPLAANVAGWAVAFAVSYMGHARLTFADAGAAANQSAPRFLVISAAGFTVNEAAYALLLGRSGLHYALALGLVLVGVALLTYFSSRHWAFARNPGR
jgi:putative flippase GtrA